MSVVHVWSGATTDTSAWVRGKVTGTSTRLAVDTDPGLSAPTYYGPAVPTVDGIVSLSATGLAAGTRYYYALEDDGVLETAFAGTFRTHPVAAGERADFVFGAAGDAGLTGVGDDSYITSAVSNNPVFDTMRKQASAEDWLFFSHLGDMHYRNIALADTALYRGAYDDNLTFNGTLGASARQGQFFRDVAMTYVWDDHDFGPNNSDRTDPGGPTANAVYRERVPHYTLPDPGGIHQSWQVGRVLFIASDVRSYRDPNGDPDGPTKTMLGTAQKTWMQQQLAADNGAEALVWISPSRLLGGADTWNSFTHERAELIQMFGDLGWLDRMLFMTADEHSLSLCTAGYNEHGGFPMYMFASMDSSYGANSRDQYDLGQSQGRQRYGTMRVVDSGHTIALTGTGWINGTVWKGHTTYVDVGTPILALDYAAGHISAPFEPTEDDQRLLNDVTTSRPDGGEHRAVDTTGRLSVLAPPDGVGPYESSVTLNVHGDDQLRDQAWWRVHRGTVDEARYPTVRVDLAANPDLADQVTALGEGDRVTIANPPDWMPPDTIVQIAEGSTEVVGAYDWDVALNASPGSPWVVAHLPDGGPETAGPDRPNRLDTAGSELGSATTATQTQVLIRTITGPVWTTDPAKLPFDIRTGGEVLRVSSVFDTDTFDRTVASGWGASGGPAWTPYWGDPDVFSVSAGEGVATSLSGYTEAATYLGVESTGFDITAGFSIASLPLSTTYVSIVLGRTGQVDPVYFDPIDLAASFRIEPSGQTDVFLSEVWRSNTATPVALTQSADIGVHGAGVVHRLRGDANGGVPRLKWWLDGTSEPSGWTISFSSQAVTMISGSPGVAVVLRNTGDQLSFTDFQMNGTQHFTVTRGINGLTKAHTAGSSVGLAQPMVLAL